MKKIISLLCAALVMMSASYVFAQTYKTTAASQLLLSGGGSPTIPVTIVAPTLGAAYTLTMPLNDGAANQVLSTDGSGILSWVTAGGGDFSGPVSSTDNAIVRFDGLTGKLGQMSPLILSDVETFFVNFVSLKADDAVTAHITLVAAPKGEGAFVTTIPGSLPNGGGARGIRSVDLQMERSGSAQVASGNYSVLSGGTDNTASGLNSVVSGGWTNEATANYTTTAGGRSNSSSAQYASTGGGNDNTTSGFGATIAGGISNIASNQSATIAGGATNTASGSEATVGGGSNNSASGTGATIGGGISNSATNPYNTIGGGLSNTANAVRSTVSGGSSNTASGDYSTVGGGNSNTAAGAYSSVAGGESNSTSGDRSTIAGGSFLTLDASADRSFGFLAYDGTNAMTISAPATAVFGNTDIWLANNDNTARGLVFFEAYNTAGAFPNTANQIRLVAPASFGADYTLTLPVNDGTANQVLTTDGTGTLSWTTTPSGVYGGNSGAASTGTQFAKVNGGGEVVTEADVQIPVTRTGTLANLYVFCTAAPGVGNDKVVTVRINGVNSALTATVSGVATTANSGATTASVTAGDLLSISVTHAGTPAASIVSWGFEVY